MSALSCGESFTNHRLFLRFNFCALLLSIMQAVIKVIGGALQAALGTSKAESMSAAANIFVGQTEAPLVVRPYIKKYDPI